MSGLADASFPLRHNLGEEAIFSMMHIPSSAPPSKGPGATMSGAAPGSFAATPGTPPQFHPPAAYPPQNTSYSPSFPSPNGAASYAPELYSTLPSAAAPRQVSQHPAPHYWPYPDAYQSSFAPAGLGAPTPALTNAPAISASALGAVVRSALRDMLHTEGWSKSLVGGLAGGEAVARSVAPPSPSLAGQGLLAAPPAPSAAASSDSSSMFLWAMIMLGVAVLALLAALVVAWRVMRSSARRRRALPDEAVSDVASTLMARRPDRLAARVWVKQILGEIRKRQGAARTRKANVSAKNRAANRIGSAPI